MPKDRRRTNVVYIEDDNHKEGAIPWHPFTTEYGDHFETNDQAIVDIKHVIEALADAMGIERRKLRIYDPYYCAGAIKKTWSSVGFPLCINDNVDCYETWKQKREKAHDIIVTNPPFSGKHKEWCLKYCVESKKPWLILLPGYCASKNYFDTHCGNLQSIFLVPNSSYTFTHPEGTGYDASPFYSIWMGSLGKYHNSVVEQCSYTFDSNVRVSESVGDLKKNKDIRSGKRPNPRARAKRRKG
eukprot:TRINITY_DN15899_c0_g1_i1.p1 TRINITY_DN15899_c0_g1~~TRINITY_DN15899_c0_g1_i1.p1  ORF type:complete len:242 (+),score=22.53 TRINITY_DN15899_c0_g1_i1:64-789(+)